MTPFRYPGSKAKTAPYIVSIFPKRNTYNDIFVGGGSVIFEIATEFPKSHIYANDKDPRVAAFWSYIATSENVRELCDRIRGFVPSVEAFRSLQNEKPTCFTAIGLNRCAFSGIMHGNPIGGNNQDSDWGVGCRYNCSAIIHKVTILNNIFRNRLTVTCLDFSEAIKVGGAFVYADPPYFHKGGGLYEQKVDHQMLRKSIDAVDEFVLSYDDCKEIRSMYSGFNIEKLNVRYCINGHKKNWNKTNELIISRKHLEQHDLLSGAFHA